MAGWKDTIDRLVQKFRTDETRFCSTTSGYTETEARVEFIDPLFECLGWDMSNSMAVPNSLKDVVREESQPTETSAKRPDYTFRIAANRKFFVEAKKPSVDIRTNKDSAFQVRSYGWTAGLPVSLLTNFKTLRVYDTSTVPHVNDNADVGLLMEVSFDELPTRFKELWSLFGREAVAAGSIDTTYGKNIKAALPIGTMFLDRINDWRLRLASDIHNRYPSLDIDPLNDLSQKVINRIIFIRMCEDRGIEGVERLRKVAGKKDVVELRRFFKEMDDRYNTGLFDVNSDPLQAQYAMDAQLFLDIVEELYFPAAPYSFSVLDAEFLGQVYELFLVKRLVLDVATGSLSLEDKPAYEDREIVTTPQPLVDEIVRRAFSGRLTELKSTGMLTFDSLKQLKVMDVAVGSSRFLLRCLDQLVDAAISYFRGINDTVNIYRKSANDYRLSFTAKREILKSCLFGIDIDYNAVEIARFSLLVKLLEDENFATLPIGKKILPNLDKNIVWGNSVVGIDFISNVSAVMSLTNPLDWSAAGLPSAFDVIVANPPYVKTEEMKSKTLDEFNYYKKKYKTAYKQFDKYFIFIEKAVSKLNNGAWVGMVVPNKWMTIESGKKLREMLAAQELVAEVVDFGNELLFEGKSTYVCLLILSRSVKKSVWYRNVHDYEDWLLSPDDKGMLLPSSMIHQYGAASWVLPSNDTEAKVLSTLFSSSIKLEDIADVINGIQTSAEDVYPIESWIEHNGLVHFEVDGVKFAVEKTITKPYLMDSARVQSYLPIESDALIIFPYEYGPNGEAILIPPSRLKTDFPRAWHYLKSFVSRLQKRDISPKPGPGEFYRYGRHQALSSAFKGPKIIYSVNQLGDKYGIDETGVGFASGGTAGEVAITNPRDGYSLEFILGLLNQRAVELFMRKRGSPFRGGYYSRGSAVVADLPVPKLDFQNPSHVQIHNKVSALVRDLITVKQRYNTAVGRQRVSLSSQQEALANEIRKQFELIWNFGGLDDTLILPGDHVYKK
ncbi:hypothetical protein BM613_13395 [Sulfoacidibacillus thermotolerans]|uniref:site-specific DNA-methyltransferase (adenine-specific) n=2 Tax=Sulfoacidibacillus thermotolerans TaxID=1765684 RepID=A0A2U3D1L3_SULT2|nr:hypothetical protein BM613_13395 [Sulfoacidibacillus thermotolerans]